MSEITLNTPFPLGKYKGMPLQTMLEKDKDYVRWLLSQTGIEDKHPALVSFLVNGPMKETKSTEQHNRMQIRLLDKKVALRVVRAAFEIIDAAETVEVLTVRFELFNWDAIIGLRVKFKSSEPSTDFNIAVELKPSISEDYPAVLRQVTNRVAADRATSRAGLYRAVLVLTDRLSSKSATKAQLVEMFKANQLKLHEWDTCDEFEFLG